jgi:hypothetical protein
MLGRQEPDPVKVLRRHCAPSGNLGDYIASISNCRERTGASRCVATPMQPGRISIDHQRTPHHAMPGGIAQQQAVAECQRERPRQRYPDVLAAQHT